MGVFCDNDNSPTPLSPLNTADSRYKLIDRTLKRFQYEPERSSSKCCTPAQEAFGYLSNDLLRYVARQLKLPVSWVYGVATFYHFFSLTPQGSHSCTLCWELPVCQAFG